MTYTATSTKHKSADRPDEVDPADQDGDASAQIFSRLIIAGQNHFQNQLLTTFLAENIQCPCKITAEPSWHSAGHDPSEGNLLLLMDCFGMVPAELWIKISGNTDLDPATWPLALFNVAGDPDPQFEKQAIDKQIRGVFYIHEKPEKVALGIRKMMQGEIWYSRKMTSQIILEHQHLRHKTEAAEAMLTPREKEILIAIASGAANIDIAEDLRISLHTVKSHIYNIYRKIDVGNRLEATLWVARYL